MSPRYAPVNSPLAMEEVVEILCNEFENITVIITQAWNTLPEHPVARTMHWRNKTRFSVVADQMRVNAIETYVNRSGEGFIILDNSDGLFGIRYEGIVFRFKFLDKHRKTRNILTGQQMSFQEPMPLPGCDEVTNVTFGYTLNPAQTDIEQIFLVSEQLGNEWQYELPFNRGFGAIEMFPAEPEAPTPRPRRVTPKVTPTREDEQEVRPANET